MTDKEKLNQIWEVATNWEPNLYYSTNREIETVFLKNKREKEIKKSWEMFQQEVEADKSKSDESREELEWEMNKRNNRDGLKKLRQELNYLECAYRSCIPCKIEPHSVWWWERSLEVLNEDGVCIKEFVWSNWTRYDEEATDLYAEYDEWYEEHEEEWGELREQIERLREDIKNIENIQKWRLRIDDIKG